MPRAIYGSSVLAEADETLRVEGNTYFPGDAVDKSRLVRSQTEYTCPWKGDAVYYHYEAGGELVEDVAWSYPDPTPAARNIAGYFAFDRNKGVLIESGA